MKIKLYSFSLFPKNVALNYDYLFTQHNRQGSNIDSNQLNRCLLGNGFIESAEPCYWGEYENVQDVNPLPRASILVKEIKPQIQITKSK